MGSAPLPEKRRAINLHPEPTPVEPPSAEWQAAAQKVLDYAAHALWSPEGAAALRYLREERGLEDWVIRRANGMIYH